MVYGSEVNVKIFHRYVYNSFRAFERTKIPAPGAFFQFFHNASLGHRWPVGGIDPAPALGNPSNFPMRLYFIFARSHKKPASAIPRGMNF